MYKFKISCKVMHNEEIVNNYENFLFFVINKLDSFFFGKEYASVEEVNNKVNCTTEINNNKTENNKKILNQDVIKLNKNNSQIIQSIIENKVIDIVIFLILRHFNSNLYSFKIEFEKESLEKFKSNDKTLILELKRQKFMYMKGEMEKKCGKLLKLLVDFLQKCVLNLSTYDHV